MANLQFSDLQNEVYAHTGLSSTGTDSNSVSISTDVNRWLNYVQQDICARWPWTFMESSEQILTVTDATGTAGINNGSTNFTDNSFKTGTSTNGYYFQFSGANNWYKQANWGSPNFPVLDQPFQGTSGSAVSYTLRKFYYSLSSSADRIINLVNWNTPVKMVQVDLKTMTELNPLAQATNTSYAYVPWGYDSSGNIQFIPYPFPSDARIIQVKTTKRPTDMVASTDTPSIPNKYAHLIAWGAIAVAFGFLRKFDLAEAWSAKVEQRITQMKSEYRLSEDYEPWLRSIDSIQRSKWIQFPGQWPTLVGS